LVGFLLRTREDLGGAFECLRQRKKKNIKKYRFGKKISQLSLERLRIRKKIIIGVHSREERNRKKERFEDFQELFFVCSNSRSFTDERLL
jgi:hypothetical protein